MPGLLIYVVSYQFVSRSIESWFDVKVEGALDAGVSLGRSSFDALAADLASKTRGVAGQLAEVPNTSAGLALERIRDQLGAVYNQLEGLHELHRSQGQDSVLGVSAL
jgi:nitrogen fixation/metabolism regulation signal transduction histidine kinase